MKAEKLPLSEKMGFAAGDMAVNVMIAGLFFLMSIFYTDVFGLDPKDMGILFFVARIVDAFTDPMMGMLTDRVKTRWGHFKHWFLFLSVPYGISVVLLYTTPDAGYAFKLIWAYATYLFATMIFTGVAIPYISLIGVMTADPKERLSANGYRMTFAKVANVIIVAAVPWLAREWGGGDDIESLQKGYPLAMSLMAIFAVGLFLFCFKETHERLEHKVDKTPIFTQIASLFRNDQWLLLCAVCVIGTVGYAIRGNVAMYYATYYLDIPKLAGVFVGAGITASIFSMIASTWITKNYCKVKLFRYSQLLVLVLSVLMYFVVGKGDVVLAFIFYILICFVVDLHAPIFWSAIAEVVDYGEFKNKRRVSGISFGGISFCQKAGGGLAGLIVGLLLTYFEYQPNVEQTDISLMGIALMLTIIPGVFHAMMGGVMFLYKITDSYYNTMMKEQKLPE
jgi:sugar (Glycoside-Pentoside-Hexuronide) transporter